MPIEIEKALVDKVIQQIEDHLASLIAIYRISEEKPELQALTVRAYHDTLKILYEMSRDKKLDWMLQFPPELMPEEYLLRHPAIRTRK